GFLASSRLSASAIALGLNSGSFFGSGSFLGGSGFLTSSCWSASAIGSGFGSGSLRSFGLGSLFASGGAGVGFVGAGFDGTGFCSTAGAGGSAEAVTISGLFATLVAGFSTGFASPILSTLGFWIAVLAPCWLPATICEKSLTEMMSTGSESTGGVCNGV